MVVTIRTYLCNKKLVGIEFADRITTNAISFSEGKVSAKILPIGSEDFRKKQVRAKIVQPEINLVECIEPEPSLSWVRKALTYDGFFVNLEDLITIEGNIPSLVCMWESAHIYGITLSPLDHNTLLVSTPDRTGGEIPDNKSDVCKIAPYITARNPQTDIVPGELIQMAWAIKVDGETHSGLAVAGAWFGSPAFTGGILQEKQGDHWIVKTHGFNRKCVPTDWANYQAGDWVYMLKQGDGEAGNCQRDSDYTSSSASNLPDDLRVVPVTVNSFGNNTGVFETLDYSMLSVGGFKEFFETSLHNGEIIEVWNEGVTPAEDKVVVDVSGLGANRDQTVRYEWVQIFYHCEDTDNISGGRRGFAVGDKVLVLNEGGFCSPNVNHLYVIGHKDGPKRCVPENVIIVSELRFRNIWWSEATPVYDPIDPELIIDYEEYIASGNAIVWDIDAGRKMDIFDIDNSIANQPMNYLRLAWLMKLGVNGNVTVEEDINSIVSVKYKDGALYGHCGNQLHPITSDPLVTWYVFQKNELKPSGIEEGRCNVESFLRYYPNDELETHNFMYLQDQQLGEHPIHYYHRFESETEGYDAWEQFVDARGYHAMVGAPVFTTPDSHLTGLKGTSTVNPVTDWLINFKDPESANFRPCESIGYDCFPYLKCSGDDTSIKRGACLSFLLSCPLSNKNPDARYRECSDTYTLKYKWKSLIPDKPVVTIDLYYPYYGQWRAPSGYSFPVNISSGVHEDSDIAVAFEYCDLHMDEWNSIGGWHYLDTYRERFFDVYMQKKEDGQDFHMDNFKEIPNMHVLRNLVYNQLDFYVTQNYYGEYLYTLSGAASGPPMPGEKIPIISFYKLDFS